jgi:AhpD family alkylhydroperoxidase
MARIDYLEPQQAGGQARELLDAVHRKLGATPNMTKAMAGSAVLEGYLALSGALAGGTVRPAVAERIALAVAQSNECSYCLSAHSYVGEHVAKLPHEEIDAARRFRASDPRASAALRFAQAVVDGRGDVTDAEFGAARDAGLSDAELAEIVGHVALNVLTNYFNKAFAVDVDFPVVQPQDTAIAA